MRDAHLSAHPPPAGAVSDAHLRPVSRRAIAASAGLSRETVRRKIASLLSQGALIETGAGVRVPDHDLEDPRNFKFAVAITREFSRIAAELSR
jgi:DeoR/GlpR family transcriptional regulator of sugar metabolism